MSIMTFKPCTAQVQHGLYNFRMNLSQFVGVIYEIWGEKNMQYTILQYHKSRRRHVIDVLGDIVKIYLKN